MYIYNNESTFAKKKSLMIDPKEIFTASIVLLAVINIVGSIPIIISLREKVGHIESEKASIIAAIIMISFLFLGDEILKIIGVDINSFAVAGALIILFLALEMILGITIFKNEAPKTASIVPIAFPMIAGAGTMTSLLSLRAEFEVTNIIIAIIINIFFVYIILRSSKIIEGWLGKSGINIIQKVMALAIVSCVFNLTQIDWGDPITGKSSVAVIGVMASASAFLLLLILILSKRVAQKLKKR